MLILPTIMFLWITNRILPIYFSGNGNQHQHMVLFCAKKAYGMDVKRTVKDEVYLPMASIMSARAANGCENNMFNRKAIIVKFLTTLLLAIIIFAPACYLSAKLFRTSTQAKDNYSDFAQELNRFAREDIGSRKSALLIMDIATALVYFEKGFPEVTVAVDAEVPYTDYTLILRKPSQCENDKNCLCLFRKSE